MGAQDVVTVHGLRKRYGDIVAVDGVGFAVRRGETFGIVGPNGAGKTTTLEIIEGLRQPDSGRVEVLGLDPQRQPAEVKQRIGVQLQASAYFDFLTLKEILELFGSFYRRRVPALQLLEMVGLRDRAGALLKQLSGGQQQRFSLAAAMVNDPEVVFLDEPTTGLDPQARRSLWDLVREMRSQGRTVILTTHYMEEAEALCDRVAIMDGGRIVALDSPEALVSRLEAPYHIRLRLAQPVEPHQLAVPGVVNVACAADGLGNLYRLQVNSVAESMPLVLSRLAELGMELVDLSVERATLEDVFLALTGKELRD
jgi:ABC-2 type transport system ATP-binding protein